MDGHPVTGGHARRTRQSGMSILVTPAIQGIPHSRHRLLGSRNAGQD